MSSDGAKRVETVRGKRVRVFWTVLLSAFGILAGFVVVASVLLAFVLGDRVPHGVKVVNGTIATVSVYAVVDVGTETVEVLQAVVPARSTVDSGVTCGRSHLIAKRGLSVVATRGPFNECNMDDWVIT
jgi:hypothetical protein